MIPIFTAELDDWGWYRRPFRVTLSVSFGEVDLYIWRSVVDGAKPDGAATNTATPWFDMVRCHWNRCEMHSEAERAWKSHSIS